MPSRTRIPQELLAWLEPRISALEQSWTKEVLAEGLISPGMQIYFEVGVKKKPIVIGKVGIFLKIVSPERLLPVSEKDWEAILSVEWSATHRAILERFRRVGDAELTPDQVRRELKKPDAQLPPFPRADINKQFKDKQLPYKLASAAVGGRRRWTELPHRVFKIER